MTRLMRQHFLAVAVVCLAGVGCARLGYIAQLLQQSLVAAVQAVKVADGESGGAGQLRLANITKRKHELALCEPFFSFPKRRPWLRSLVFRA